MAGQDNVRRLMRLMGIAAMYPKKNLSVATHSHKKYPYVLRGVAITHPTQGWSTDSTDGARGKGLCVPDSHDRVVEPLWTVIETFHDRSSGALASRRYRKPGRAMGTQKYSLPIRGARTRAKPSLAS